MHEQKHCHRFNRLKDNATNIVGYERLNHQNTQDQKNSQTILNNTENSRQLHMTCSVYDSSSCACSSERSKRAGQSLLLSAEAAKLLCRCFFTAKYTKYVAKYNIGANTRHCCTHRTILSIGFNIAKLQDVKREYKEV